MTNVEAPPTKARRKSNWAAPLVMVSGVMLVPWLLVVVFNRYEAPDAAAYVRMTFATVAGQTVAIVTVVALLVTRITSRARLSETITYALIGVAVTIGAVSKIGWASELLLQSLASLG